MPIEAGQPIKASEVNAAFSAKENLSNKTTSLSTASTDAQYPSAKAVYDKLKTLDFFPKGTILMYDGTSWTDNVTLKGWYQCKGGTANGLTIPDLRDKFIMGYNSGSRTGGANLQTLSTSQLPGHNHSLTALTLGNESAHTHTVAATTDTKTHSHTFSGTNQTGAFGADILGGGGLFCDISGVFSKGVAGRKDTVGGVDSYSPRNLQRVINFSMTPSGTISGDGSHSHDFSVTSGSGANHTHSLSSSTISSTGSGTAFDNRPSYYALIYIIKVTNAGE